MKLNVQERLVLARIVPEKGNFETMATIENLKKLLYLSEEEVLKYELKDNTINVTWNEKGKLQVEIKITKKGIEILIKALEKMDKENSLTLSHYKLFKRFKQMNG